MECKACHQSLAAGAGRKVAEWLFCEACFGALMEKRPSPPAPAPAAAPRRGQPPCALCKGPLGAGAEAGNGRLCEGCLAVMRVLSNPEAVVTTEPAPPPAAPLVEQQPISWASVSCAGCGKRIQERASKSSEGRPYCPDCHHALPPPPQAAPPPVPAPSPGACDACGRDAAPGTELRGGFSLCAPCRTTDEPLALELARARHRKRMEQLKVQLLP